MNYAIVADTNLKTERMFEYQFVKAGSVLGYLEDIKSHVNKLILDVYRDNPFERS